MRVLAVDEPLKAWSRLLNAIRELGLALDVEKAERCLARLSSGTYAVLLLALLSPAAWGLLESVEDMQTRPSILAFRAEKDSQAESRARALGVDEVLTLPCTLTRLMLCLPEPIGARGAPPLRIAGLELDPYRRQVRRQGEFIELTRREFDLLVLLAGHAGKALSRTWLVEQLWGYGEVTINSLDVHIYRLREKLDRPFSAKLIRTVRGTGYRLAVSGEDEFCMGCSAEQGRGSE